MANRQLVGFLRHQIALVALGDPWFLHYTATHSSSFWSQMHHFLPAIGPPLCHNDIMIYTSTQGRASSVSDSVCQLLAWAQLQQAVASTFAPIKTWLSLSATRQWQTQAVRREITKILKGWKGEKKSDRSANTLGGSGNIVSLSLEFVESFSFINNEKGTILCHLCLISFFLFTCNFIKCLCKWVILQLLFSIYLVWEDLHFGQPVPTTVTMAPILGKPVQSL